jgi:PAS domain S-box-containing protein
MKAGKSAARTSRSGLGAFAGLFNVGGAESRLLQSISGAQVFDFIEDMPVGVSLFDDQDRLVRCNKKTLELAGASAADYVPGRTFEEILRAAVRAEVVPGARNREDDYISERLAMHRSPGAPFVVKADDRWVQVSEHLVDDVGLVVFHTDITDQKDIQTALAGSEQRFRDYAESSSDWMWETDRDLRYVYHSAFDRPGRGVRELPGQYLGKTRWEVAGVDNPGSDPNWADHVSTLEARRPFRDFRYSVVVRGKVEHYRLNGRPFFDNEDVFAGYRGTTTIETEAVERLRQLNLQQSQLSDAIDQVLVGVALYDENDRLIMRNNLERDFGALAPIVKPGAKFSDLVRETVYQGVFPDAVGREEEFIEERLERHRNPGGSFEYLRAGRWMVVRENRFANGHTMAVFTDITDIKRAEEAVRESEGKFRSLVEGSLQGVCIHRDLRPVFANQAFADIFGFADVADVLALDSLLLLFPEDQWREIAGRAHGRQVQSRGPETLVQQAVRRNGEPFYVESRLGRIEWEGAPALQVSVIDVTDRETMTQLKDEFVSTVSHELRTPLTSISGALGLIASGMAGHVPPKIRELIEIANNNAERLVRLIGDILDVQKIESGRIGGSFAAIDVAGLLATSADANAGLAEKSNLLIKVTNGMGVTSVHGDLDQLMQVMTNLLSNAIKFSPVKGAIDVAAEHHDGFIVISVSDQGPGVPTEYRESIFEKFVQVESSDNRARGGTGLGLSICKSLVNHHGGTMGYGDRPEGGARFWFSLPAYSKG